MTPTTLSPAFGPVRPSEPAAVPAVLDVALHDYAIAVAPRSVRSGTVTLSVVNEDAAPHNVVLISTDLPPARLPTIGIRVDESSPTLVVVARTPTLRPGGAGDVTASLARGRYILVCTVPHHYVRDSMLAILQVD